MKTFHITPNTEIVCEWVKTRTAFKHTATLLHNGEEQDSTKVCYQNRTWESYEYETVLRKMLEKTSLVTKEEREEFFKRQSQKSHDETSSMFRSVRAVALMGEVLCTEKKDKNDWKARMLKAGLPGLDIPSDWETLDEEEKEKRLDNVLKMMT